MIRLPILLRSRSFLAAATNSYKTIHTNSSGNRGDNGNLNSKKNVNNKSNGNKKANENKDSIATKNTDTNVTGKGKDGKPKPRPPSFIFPNLHQRIIDRLVDDGVSTSYEFHKTDRNLKAAATWDTHVMGRFRCTTGGCGGRWSSKKVAIRIRRFRVGVGGKSKAYNALVYNQKCKKCEKRGVFELDENSYVDRVVYRIKVWEDVHVEELPHGEQTGPEHEQHLCEGCIRGICLKGRGVHYNF
ncbi:zinc-binding domain-containing protein [Cladorrhinum sp. PSN259]|nr:zinc-binding domain-containing protein [Cladorrhinum sp. PSN259]